MKVSLSRPERLLLAQVINVSLNNATLLEHIRLESLITSVDLESIKQPTVMDLVPPENVDLFSKYEGMNLNDIKDENDKKILTEALQRQRVEDMKFWANEDTELKELEVSNEQINLVKKFFDQDKRPFPKEYHKAIVALHGKLFDNKK